MFRRSREDPTNRSVLASALFLLGLGCGGDAGFPEPVVVVGATVFDGSSERTIPDAVVSIREGTFQCVGSRRTCPIPTDARVIDGSGHWITPGFIDTHVHLWWGRDSSWTAASQTLRLAAGITTVRDMSSSWQLSATLRAAERSEAAGHPTPRVFSSGRLSIAPAGDKAPDAYARRASELIDNGADGLKVKGAISAPGLARALAVADRRSQDVYGHLPDVARSLSEAEEAFLLGFDGVVHVDQLGRILQATPAVRPMDGAQRPAWIDQWRNIDAELESQLIEAMVGDDVWLEATLVAQYLRVYPEAYAGAAALRYVPEHRAAELRADTIRSRDADAAVLSLRRMGDFIARFAARGGTVVVGSDQRDLPGVSLHLEMYLLVEAGIEPANVLRAATSDAAAVLGWSGRLGTVEAGKTADMVLLTADPFADIRNTRDVRLVFKGGVVYDPRELESGLTGLGR